MKIPAPRFFPLAVSVLGLCGLPLVPALAPASRADVFSFAETQNLQKLLVDLQAIAAGSRITEAQRQALASDLLLLVNGTTKPSRESLAALVGDLADAFADRGLSLLEIVRLGTDLNAVLNSAGLSPAESQAIVADLGNALASSGVTAAEVQAVLDDLNAIVAEVQVNFVTTGRTLVLAPAAGSNASGSVQLDSLDREDEPTASLLRVQVAGIPASTYTVRVTKASDNSSLSLGSLRVIGQGSQGGVGLAIFGGVGGAGLPTGFDPENLAVLTVAAANGATLLRADFRNAAEVRKFLRVANFRLEPGAAAPAALGNVSFQTKIKAGRSVDEFLLFARRLPASATLTLKVNGAAVGQVATDAKGRLVLARGSVALPFKIDGVTPRPSTPLPDAVNLATLQTLELDDSRGATVARAGF